MTFNTSQGQTVDKFGLDIATPAFSHGKMYTKMPRERDEDSICTAIKPILINIFK